jgi:hypothetical protein
MRVGADAGDADRDAARILPRRRQQLRQPGEAGIPRHGDEGTEGTIGQDGGEIRHRVEGQVLQLRCNRIGVDAEQPDGLAIRPRPRQLRQHDGAGGAGPVHHRDGLA